SADIESRSVLSGGPPGAPLVHSSGGALPRFRRGNSGAKQPLTSNHFFSIPDTERHQRPSSQVAPIASAWTDLTNTRVSQ
ncbi:hypothetical protein PIB30_106100, partial [Stylosanthes scabra]|nr:hypothetical protein [Stylosanthes scabra]